LITHIKIIDFQSHRSTQLAPSPGVNVIVGRNNTGKSAILRALRLLFYNRPEGGDFVRWGARDAIVEVEYAGHILRRVKGAHNTYAVDGAIFDHFGRQVPIEVSNVLGFHAVNVDRNTYELNFDYPHDPPFFVSETEASKGKLFTKLGEKVLGDLVLLDSCIHSINTELRALGEEKTVIESQQNKLRTTLEDFAEMPSLLEELSQVKNLVAEVISLGNVKNEMDELWKEYTAVVSNISYSSSFLTLDVQPLEEILLSIGQLTEEADLLTDFRNRVESLSATVAATAKLVGVSEGPLGELENTLAAIDTVKKTLSELRDLHLQAQTYEKAADAAHQKVRSTTTDLATAVEDYKRCLIQCKKCPFCNREVGQHDLEMILEEMD